MLPITAIRSAKLILNPSYSNGGTFTLTNATSATATFEFNGTGVWLYGAKRPNHGTYSVLMDGENAGNMSGSSSDGLQPLSASGLCIYFLFEICLLCLTL